MTDQITNVHQALQDAATQAEPSHPMIHATYRIEDGAKEMASEICKRNGTTLSGFLRSCCHALIRDYHPKPEEAPKDPAQP